MPNTLKRYLILTSWPIVVAMIALMVFGIRAIGVSQRAESVPVGFMSKQIIFACLGLGVFLVATLVPYLRVGRLAYVLFALTLVLLAVVFFLPPIRGSHRWIDLKIVLLQPSEVAKLTFVILLASYLSKAENYRRLLGLVVPFVLTLVPMAMIFREPDLGTCLLLLPTLYIMLFMAGAKMKHLLSIVVIGTALLFIPVPRRAPTLPTDQTIEETAQVEVELETRRALAYWSSKHDGSERLWSAAPLAMMKNHQIQRIDGWLRQNDERIVQTKGYQLFQSKMIMGAGRWWGRSGWNDADTYFKMLPDDHTDFIFSVIGGQWGFAGCCAILLLYAVIFLFGVEIAVATHDAFGRLLAIGVLAMLFSQIVINVGMTMGLMPITGMTLPLVSYGGSSLLVNCAAIGLLINVGQRRPILLSRRPFEFGPKKQTPMAPYEPLAEMRNAQAGGRNRHND